MMDIMTNINEGIHKTTKIIELIRSNPLWKFAVVPRRYHATENTPMIVLKIQTALIKITKDKSSKIQNDT
jgi:hypothetical protein